jgi:hypothetical protein
MMIKTNVRIQLNVPIDSNQYANRLIIAMTKKQIDVKAVFMPVTPAFFLLLKKKIIEISKNVMSNIDSMI